MSSCGPYTHIPLRPQRSENPRWITVRQWWYECVYVECEHWECMPVLVSVRWNGLQEQPAIIVGKYYLVSLRHPEEG